MTTAGDVINLSLTASGVLGVGQTALAQDSNRALLILNMMLEQWQMAPFASLATVGTFPSEYYEAFVWGLAKRLRPIYRKPPDELIDKLAMDALSLIRNQVAAPVPGTTTATDLISLAFRAAGVVGVAQTPLPRDLADGLNLVNMMLEQWQRRRWLVYHLVDRALLMSNKKSYTIGPGADFDVMRPDRVEAAFIRFNPTPGQNGASDFNADFGPDFGGEPDPGNGMPIDYGLRLLESREDYNRIALKNLRSFPQYLFYDSANTWGNLFPWPIPNNQYELHISLKEVLGQFPSLTTVITLPPEYAEAIWTNLTLRVGALYPGVAKVDPLIAAMARASLGTIRGANAQVPTLQMPRALVPRGGGYNIFGDTSGPIN